MLEIVFILVRVALGKGLEAIQGAEADLSVDVVGQSEQLLSQAVEVGKGDGGTLLVSAKHVVSHLRQAHEGVLLGSGGFESFSE